MRERVKAFRDQINAQLTPRLRFLFIAAMAVTLMVLLEEINAANIQKQARITQIRAQLSQFSGEDESAVWQDRVALAAAAEALWNARYWQAETPGIAAAQAQSVMTVIARDAGFERVRIQVQGDPVPVDGINMLGFEFSGVGDSHQTAYFLTELLAYPNHIEIAEQSTAFRDNQKMNTTISGFIPYLPAEGNR